MNLWHTLYFNEKYSLEFDFLLLAFTFVAYPV